MTTYAEFLTQKRRPPSEAGLAYRDPHALLFAWQRELVAWALRKGRAALFADCGLGKTLMQLEWARHFERALIVAPLGVAPQTIAEGARIGLDVAKVARPTDSDAPLTITNYEKLSHFVGAPYDAIVLDESSILKSLDGKTRTMLLRKFTMIPYRLCCTATPAPNDISELGNHAEFVGALTSAEMLAMFFVHDDAGWRLKGHAREAFWRWVAHWGCFVRAPSDLGHDDDGFVLPALEIRDEVVAASYRPRGQLFADAPGGVGGRLQARRQTVAPRIQHAAQTIEATGDQWVVWCGLNDEASGLAQRLGERCVEISGADSEESRIDKAERWRAGAAQVLISKPKIYGHGMNWQHCHRMMFLGMGDSYEQYYQAIRRCWRFGQTQPVDVRIVVSDAEVAVAANVKRKETQHAQMAEGVARAVRDVQLAEVCGMDIKTTDYVTDAQSGDGWTMRLGDTVEVLPTFDPHSVGLSVFSPPFASLYTYSASERDVGNCGGYDEFFAQFRFVIPSLLRATMPGRRACVHVQQVSTMKAVHGVIGWYDFRADTVKAFTSAGWVYDGAVVIDKDPQAQAIRTHSKALLFVQKERDSAWLRPAMADYILLFRAPGDNPAPIHPDVTNDEWIRWARPIWYGIDETDTLNYREAREEKDERHICPLQLGTIERCVRLWSNPGDLVLDPFAGIGSTGYVACRQARRFIGIELKRAYWQTACRNLDAARRQLSLGLTP
jgi:DNA modification methylase